MSETKLSPGGQTKGGGSQHPESKTRARIQWYGPELEHGVFQGDGFEDAWAMQPMDHDDPWRVFFNNPWNKTGTAVRKAASEHEKHGNSIEIIGLFPCSMNAKHWPLVEQAPARCYLNKRPSFLADGVLKRGNPKDVAIVYWGSRPYRFADVFSSIGRIHFGVLNA
jgi:hypothetical protein